MRILAIETSCDETACAVVENTTDGLVRILAETVASSQEIHTKTGGIVPEVAGREQIKAMIPVVEQTLEKAAKKTGQVLNSKLQTINWALENIDAIAVTVGPGLIGSLLVGTETAKTLSLAWDKPLVAVNHLHGHIFANFIANEELITKNEKLNRPEFPVVGLTVSGGHTDLILMKDHGEIELLGSTRDDAAGECLDKCARLLGLPYPGGPSIAKIAMKHQITSIKSQTPAPDGAGQANTKSEIKTIKLPKPLIDEGYDFSFSGLKVAVDREFRQRIQTETPNFTLDKNSDRDAIVSEIAFELQETVVEILVTKTVRAIEEFKPKSVFLSGGVAANTNLREMLSAKCQKLGTPFYVPEIKYCTDNAAMVGAAALYKHKEIAVLSVKPDPSLEMTDH